MKRVIYFCGVVFFSLIMISLSGCYYDNEQDLYQYVNDQQCDTTNVTFSGTVLPIFNSYCNACHNTSNTLSNVILDTYAGTSVVAANGKLWGSISWTSGYLVMPQTGSQLSDCDLKKIKAWLNAGYKNN